jgi:ketosteroid isomerase-like protein
VSSRNESASVSFYGEIEAFFADYVDAFARNNANALSELWDDVGLFPSPTGNFAMERSAFREHCVGLMDFYRQQGVIRPEGKLLSVIELFPDVANVRMAYRMLGDDEKLIAEWEHVYILRRAERWRISLTIADGEMAAWEARGAAL